MCSSQKLVGCAIYAYEHRRGAVKVGKQADLTVLSRDILAVDAAALLDTRVLMTIVGGRVVYSAS